MAGQPRHAALIPYGHVHADPRAVCLPLGTLAVLVPSRPRLRAQHYLLPVRRKRRLRSGPCVEPRNGVDGPSSQIVEESCSCWVEVSVLPLILRASIFVVLAGFGGYPAGSGRICVFYGLVIGLDVFRSGYCINTILAMTLGPQPYYWPNTKTVSYGGSPPIATRSGFMALGLFPFVVLLSSKANWITLVTGISHEKLQVSSIYIKRDRANHRTVKVFHRWTSWAMFVLAIVHTFPFIIVHIGKGDMMLQWRTSLVYWTGVAALIPQAYLNIMSIGPIRCVPHGMNSRHPADT